MFAGGARHFLHEAWPGFMAATLVVVLRVLDVRLPLDAQTPLQVLLVAIAGLMLFHAKRPARFFGLVVFGFVLTALYQPGQTVIERARSFFGVHKVVETADGRHRLLFHGTTIHGAERIDDAGSQRPEPLTYYYFGGPLSEAIGSARGARGGLDRVAVVGLGTGSLACHQRDGEHWTFFEIDPEVARIARNDREFHFLSACGPMDEIVLGDARLTLATSSVRYGLIVLDAFSSDAVPVHLLTREALSGYLARLEPHGIIVFHVSNRHMDLASVVAAVGSTEGLIAYFKEDDSANDFLNDYHANAQVVVMARAVEDLGDLPSRSRWRRLESKVAPWTDDYSDVLRAILRKKLGD
jgi:spermidine synthase